MNSSSKAVFAFIAVLAVIAVVIVAVYARPTDSSANDASGRPEYFNWIGVVAGSNNTPLGGISVTLHLMTPDGEACNRTNLTLSGSSYPGSYAFYDVPLPEDVTYAYAVADSGDLGGGVHCLGRTDNIEINKTNITSGIIVLDIPGSDNISVTNVMEGWYGTVIDNSGTGLGNVTVTLHLMSQEGEIATATTQTISTGPYPGTFVFDSISLPDNATFGYVTADTGDLDNGVHNTARSDDYALNKSRISSGFMILE